MKKTLLIIGSLLMALSLMSVGYVNWKKVDVKAPEKIQTDNKAFAGQMLFTTLVPPAEFVYNIDSRFFTTITKEQLLSAKSILDIVPIKATKKVAAYQDVKVAILDGEDETTAMGIDDQLTPHQLELFQSADYSTDFYVYSNYKRKNEASGELLPDYFSYYLSIIPEKEAEYINGNTALIDYLKTNSKSAIANTYEDKINPGRIRFIVTKDGTISNVKLTSSSGYDKIDETMEKLISTIPGQWNPATNSKGEKVDQELVFFFGRQGC